MSKILIVESGSSKADWVVIENGFSILEFQSKGWNPLFMGAEEMYSRINLHIHLKSLFTSIEQVYFYAPGCAHQESKKMLKNTLEAIFVNAIVDVESDLLAAARATYHDKPLFVSILGTGSNTAFYDGEVLEQFTPSLGFILGDEGSGASLGRALLKAYLYKQLPSDLYLEFSKEYAISKELVLSTVYKRDKANRFLASYVPFLVDHKKHLFVEKLVKVEFENYLDTHILSNPMKSDYPIAFVGSVAFYFQDFLTDLCSEKKLSVNKFVKLPLKSLVDFHVKSKSL